MRRFLTSALVISALGATGLGACAPVEWQHPDYGTTHLEADLADCDHIAMQEQGRYSWNQPPFAIPHIYSLPSGVRVMDPNPYYSASPYSNTSELRSFCMRSKGYELMPVQEPAG